MFPMDAWYLFFGRLLKFDPNIVFYERPNRHVQTLSLNILNSVKPQASQKLKPHKEIICTSKLNVKLSTLLAQRSFNSFALKGESPQIKLVNDKEVSLGLICDHYIETFNSFMNIGRIFHAIRVAPKGFNKSYVFKNGGTLSTMTFLKWCNKLSRLVSLSFNHKDLRANPFEDGEFDA